MAELHVTIITHTSVENCPANTLAHRYILFWISHVTFKSGHSVKRTAQAFCLQIKGKMCSRFDFYMTLWHLASRAIKLKRDDRPRQGYLVHCI